MTDNEIIKALECCIKSGTIADCKANCPLDVTECMGEGVSITYPLVKKIIDLINRQKAEIEELNNTVDAYKRECNKLSNLIPKARAEAVKEFAERLKLHSYFECSITGHKYQVVQIEDIDNLVKEMVGAESG